ncbi:MAG: hypothetical protein Q8O82_07860 [Pseudorhodobacter sp.]|nr:hypothetical protein [Pseudorhodobacter sp.]
MAVNDANVGNAAKTTERDQGFSLTFGLRLVLVPLVFIIESPLAGASTNPAVCSVAASEPPQKRIKRARIVGVRVFQHSQR